VNGYPPIRRSARPRRSLPPGIGRASGKRQQSHPAHRPRPNEDFSIEEGPCRIRDNSSFEIVDERPLSNEAQEANILQDAVVNMGKSSKANERPDHPIRIVTIKVTPHVKRGKSGGGGSTGPACDGYLRLATNLLDVPVGLQRLERQRRPTNVLGVDVTRGGEVRVGRRSCNRRCKPAVAGNGRTTMRRVHQTRRLSHPTRKSRAEQYWLRPFLLSQVYARADQPCRCCRRPIRRCVIGGRATYYCTGCQHGRVRHDWN